MAKKTKSNYKKVWKKECKSNNSKFNSGLKLGLLSTTNNKEIRKMIKNLKC